MAKFIFSLNISGEIEAPTLEAAREKLDYSINFDYLKQRGVNITRTWEEVSKLADTPLASVGPSLDTPSMG